MKRDAAMSMDILRRMGTYKTDVQSVNRSDTLRTDSVAESYDDENYETDFERP